MTRVTRNIADTLHKEALYSAAADASFVSNGFAAYKIGPDARILEAREGLDFPPIKDIVMQEASQLEEQQKRLSVRDLASKFENGLPTAATLPNEVKFRDVVSFDKHILLKKLRDVLESLRERVAGKNKDDVKEAISMVEALAVQLTQREGEILQEKSELKKLANFLKQASEDAKTIVEQERASARAEIETARATVKRIEQAIKEQEQISETCEKKVMENLMEEVQEARRIKMLHKPSKAMDMEVELKALRDQLAEKSKHSVLLKKELAMSKRVGENKLSLYQFEGAEALCSCLRITARNDAAIDVFECSIQWFRISVEGDKREMIFGANKSVYAPEPFDVGWCLQAEIVANDQSFLVTTTGPIDPAAGLGSFVEALLRKEDIEFNVIISQMNGLEHPIQSIHVFHVGKMRIKLRKGWMTIAKEPYSSSMQMCGVRGGGNAAAQALFWQVKKGLSFTLAFETERDRNVAIMLSRRFAFDCNIMLVGPGDRSSL